MNQRWRSRRDSYRPPEEPIRTREYEVAELVGDKLAKAFVLEHHYERSYPSARFRYGLFHRGDLVGVAVYSVGTNDQTLKRVFGDARGSVELGRFVLLDEVPGNGETWFLARTFEDLKKKGLRGVLSMSDPVPRTDSEGREVFPGHIGTIYQAHNALYLGRAKARTVRLLPDGRVFSERTLQKIRAREHGWKYGVQILVGYGAEEPTGDLREWVDLWLPRLSRPLWHPGKYRYAWHLASRRQHVLVPNYPKRKGKE